MRVTKLSMGHHYNLGVEVIITDSDCKLRPCKDADNAKPIGLLNFLNTNLLIRNNLQPGLSGDETKLLWSF